MDVATPQPFSPHRSDAFVSIDRKPSVVEDDRRVLTTLSVACLCYFTVSGGPVGAEGIVAAGGPLVGLVSLVVFPFVLCIPIALITAELSTAFPQNGGFTVWVQQAFGPFWAFQEGYWAWLSAVIYSALYPSVALNVLVGFYPSLEDATVAWVLKIAFAILFAIPNFLGIEVVGRGMAVMCVFVTVPYVLFSIWGFAAADDWSALGQVRYADTGASTTEYISTGDQDIQWRLLVATLFWNYNNFANVSAFAGQVINPEKAYPRALLIMVIAVIWTYVLPLAAGVVWNGDPLWPSWDAGSIVDLARGMGGDFLLIVISIAYLGSNCGLYSSQLFCATFLLSGMAETGLAPRVFDMRWKRNGVPIYAVGLGFAIILVLAGLDFDAILTMCNVISALSQVLLLGAAIQLRRTQPDLHRPYRVPGNVSTLVAMSFPPMCLFAYLIYIIFTGDSAVPMYLVPAVVVVGFVYAYAMLRRETKAHEELMHAQEGREA